MTVLYLFTDCRKNFLNADSACIIVTSKNYFLRNRSFYCIIHLKPPNNYYLSLYCIFTNCIENRVNYFSLYYSLINSDTLKIPCTLYNNIDVVLYYLALYLDTVKGLRHSSINVNPVIYYYNSTIICHPNVS